MADYLSPGVFVEEVPTAAQIVPGVTTSNLGIIGYAARGPANQAVLIQSYEQFTRAFGGLVKESFMPLSLAAFFANGGRRAYVVRVPPSDATASNAKIQSVSTNVEIGVGDGSETLFEGAFETAGGAGPLAPGSITVAWREAGTPATNITARDRADANDVVLADGVDSYECCVPPGELPTLVSEFDAIVRGTVTVKFTLDSEGLVSIAVPAGTSSIVQAAAGDGTNGALVLFDHKSGRFSLRTYGTFVPVAADNGANITVDFTPTTETSSADDGLGSIVVVDGSALADGDTFTIDDGTNAAIMFEYDSNGMSTGLPIPFSAADSLAEVRDATIAAINNASPLLLKAVAVAGADDQIKLVPNSAAAVEITMAEAVSAGGFSVAPTTASTSGLWVGDVGAPGAIDYATGQFSMDLSGFVPAMAVQLLATYTQNAWDLNPISVGAWGNNLQVQIAGSPDYYNAATASYSRFDMFVLLRETSASSFVVVEQYEEMVFDDPTSPVYFADVVNELSEYITVTEPAGNVAPKQLNGVAHSMVLGGGDGTAGNKAFSATLLNKPIQTRTLRISYTNTSGVAQTITDDGNGNLTGSVVSSAVNTINYTTGAIAFTAKDLIKGGTLVVATYTSKVGETVHVETFGDADKDYQIGTEGTFDSSHWGRSQFTDMTALAADNKGLYAFNKVEEILQIAVPDFAGNLIVTGDQLDYAAMRTSLPSGGDRFIILTPPQGYTAQKAVDWYRFDLNRNSDYAALYWPWVRVTDPLQNNRPVLMPPLGHIAGVYARTDANKNVGKSPGGTVDGALAYLVGLETNPTQADRDVVYPNKINPLIASTQTGLAVWGVRTISNVPDWRYINARRLFMFLEKSIFNATWWIVFENNGPGLWARIKAQLDSFLGNLYSQGYFAGVNPAQAYFVVCDESNNTAATIDAGQVIIDIGVAPNKPAEFVRLRFQQKSLNS